MGEAKCEKQMRKANERRDENEDERKEFEFETFSNRNWIWNSLSVNFCCRFKASSDV